MFMDSDSFYYSLTYDLTNSVQRQSACEKTNLALWRKVSGSGFCVWGCFVVFGFVSVFFWWWLVGFFCVWLPFFPLLGNVLFNNVCGSNLSGHILCWCNLQQFKLLPCNELQCGEVKQKPPGACLGLSCCIEKQ